jgi:hypothetical protein
MQLRNPHAIGFLYFPVVYHTCRHAKCNRNLNNCLILEIVGRVHHLVAAGTTIAFLGLPSYVGLPGNSTVDAAAKAALGQTASSIHAPISDFLQALCSACGGDGWWSGTLRVLISYIPFSRGFLHKLGFLNCHVETTQ